MKLNLTIIRNLKKRVLMTNIIKVSLLLIFMCSSLFSNENYTKEKIERMISKMVVLGFKGESVNQDDEIYKNIKSGLGGVILFDKDPTNKKKIKNIKNPIQLKNLTSQLQAISKDKLLISIDQEGGIVQRLNTKNGFISTPKASEISLENKKYASMVYKDLAKQLNQNGINVNFAPVVDLAINKDNKVIYKLGRSYSSEPKKVYEYSSIFVDELKKENVLSVLKHFPGHGSSLSDSHLGFVDITKTWKEIELQPYKDFIKNKKVDMIMTAHVFNSNLDKSYPATLSYNINTKLLRNKLGFKGVLITDDLQMYAISKHYDLKQTLTLAINSGVNMLLFANQQAKEIKLEEIVETIYSQILSEEISLERIIESNKNINRLFTKH